MPKLTEELAGPLRQMQVCMLHLFLTTIGILFNHFCGHYFPYYNLLSHHHHHLHGHH